MGNETERVQARAVEKRPGAERVKTRYGSITELRGLIQLYRVVITTGGSNNNDLPLVIDHAACSHRNQNGNQRDVE